MKSAFLLVNFWKWDPASLISTMIFFQLYVIGVELNGVELDRQKFLEITGREDLVFMYDAANHSFKSGAVSNLYDFICQDPCDHSLHKHIPNADV